MTAPYRLQFVREAATRLDVDPPEKADPQYALRYVPPAGPSIRSTIRHKVSQATIDPVVEQIDAVFSDIAGRSRTGTGPRIAPSERDVEHLKSHGGLLWDLLLPRSVQTGLTSHRQVLELGLNTELLHYPWELLHDGEDFICLRHSIARSINVGEGASVHPAGWTQPVGRLIDKVAVLLISVRAPSPDTSEAFEDLPEVETETREIIGCLADRAQVHLTVLQDGHATLENIRAAARQGCDLVHFSGHGVIDSASKDYSLVLQKQLLPASALASVFATRPPLLFFLNACHSSGVGDVTTVARRWLNGPSFASALLQQGSYLLGSRWPLADDGAAIFASTFYGHLLRQMIGSPRPAATAAHPDRNASLGEAITAAREECAARARASLAWGSYVFYGDPRLAFIRTPWGRRAERDRILLSLAERVIETMEAER